MADGAGKLDRLARLKSLKSGMKAKPRPSSDDGDALDLDTLFDDGGDDGAVAPEPAARKPAESEPGPAAPGVDVAESVEPARIDENKEDSDPESLSAYFEALGIVPDSKKVPGGARAVPGTAPSVPKPAPKPEPEPKPEPAARGRDVDARDRWADPVREDDAFLSSFAGEGRPGNDDEDLQSLDSIIDSFDEDPAGEAPPPQAETVQRTDTAPEAEPEPEPAEDGASADPEPAVQASPEPVEQAADDEEVPEFGNDIDIEAFEREIALSEKAGAKKPESPESETADAIELPHVADAGDQPADADPPLTITFDEGRAKMLADVSRQMGCSIDDVVVTAVDWYLDALFGEDEQEAEAGPGE